MTTTTTRRTTTTSSSSSAPSSSSTTSSSSSASSPAWFLRKISISSLQSSAASGCSPPLPTAVVDAMKEVRQQGQKPTLRYWIQGIIQEMKDQELLISDVDDPHLNSPLLVSLRRLPDHQLETIGIGSYSMIIGTVKERRSSTGVAMLAHSIKDLSLEFELRREMWKWELEDQQQLDQQREEGTQHQQQ